MFKSLITMTLRTWLKLDQILQEILRFHRISSCEQPCLFSSELYLNPFLLADLKHLK